MCRQEFAHCSCEHTMLEEKPCELASSHPFYLKVACPNYEIIREDCGRRCGSGKFYCKEDGEGEFFEQVYNIFVQTQMELQHIKDQRAPIFAQSAEFTRQADALGWSTETRQCHDVYRSITDRMAELKSEHSKVAEQCRVAQAVLQEGNKLVATREAQKQSDFGPQTLPMTISTSLRCKLPMELQTLLAKATRTNPVVESTITAEAIDISNYEKNAVWTTFSPTPGEGTMYQTPQHSVLARELSFGLQTTPCPTQPKLQGDRGSLPAFAKGGRSIKRSIGQNLAEEAQRLPTRQSPAMKKTALAHESSFVRRSTRVRNKKVNYAESEASTSHSRENSPFKSDADHNSPPKSDVSPSPSPSPERKPLRHRRKASDLRKGRSTPSNNTSTRGNGTLTGLIDKWRRGADTVLNPMQRTDSAISGISTARMPQVNAWPHTMQMNATENSLSMLPGLSGNTIHNIPQNPVAAQNKWTIPAMPVPNNVDWQQLSGNVKFMPSTPGPVPVPSYQNNVIINQPMQSHGGIANEKGQVFQTPPARMSFDYDKLRRSFSASQDLTPSALVTTTSVDTDPKKRSLSTSSPLPSAKRMRLSLPGDSIPSVYDQNLIYTAATSMSSPSKMASQQLPTNTEKEINELPAPVTPAPILAPTAKMYTPRQQFDAGDVAARSEAPNFAEESSANENFGDDADNPSSDIDWDLLVDAF